MEVETDKVVTEIPTVVSGTLLKIYVPQGQSVKVGEAMALIGNPGKSEESKPAPEPVKEPEFVAALAQTEKQKVPAAAEPEKQAAPAPAVISNQTLSPLVKRMLEENKLDPAQFKGTGAEGRITKQDVEAYLAAPQPKQAAVPEPAPMPAPVKSQPVEPREGDQLIPHANTRKQIAERMVASLRPHHMS